MRRNNKIYLFLGIFVLFFTLNIAYKQPISHWNLFLFSNFFAGLWGIFRGVSSYMENSLFFSLFKRLEHIMLAAMVASYLVWRLQTDNAIHYVVQWFHEVRLWF